MDKRRLRRLESKGYKGNRELFDCIRKGMFYDELSPVLQIQYEKYKGYQISGIVTLNHYVLGTDLDDYHVPLEFNPRPPTPEEHQKNLEEIERFVLEAQEEYNRQDNESN